ncbi:unnamed protein product [Arabidopsis halleri]
MITKALFGNIVYGDNRSMKVLRYSRSSKDHHVDETRLQGWLCLCSLFKTAVREQFGENIYRLPI